MALRWIEGWEACNNNTTTQDRLYESTGGTLLSAKNGANHESDESAAQDDGFFLTDPIVATPQNSWIIGFAMQADDFVHIEDSDAAHFAFVNDDGEQCRIEVADWTPLSTKPQGAYYKFRFMRGTTELASTIEHFWVRTVDHEQWVYFEFKVTIDNAAGSIEGRFHHINKPSLNPAGAYTAFTWDAATTSLDTQEQTSTGANRFELSFDTGNSNEEIVVDDLYVCDSTGAKNNDYLGKCAVSGQKPLNSGGGDGDTVDWTLAGGASSTYDAWFENVGSIENDEILTSDTLDQVHLSVVDTLLPTSGLKVGANSTIIGVRHDYHARMETTGDLDLIHYMRKTTGTPAETEVGTAQNFASTAMEASTVILEDDPNTATDWVRTDMDSYQYGVKNKG
jgi:hypothetical protein